MQQDTDREFADRRALQLVQAAFLEMPGLQLTRDQAARLCAIDRGTCEAVLRTLVDAGFLVKTKHAMFARASEIVAGV